VSPIADRTIRIGARVSPSLALVKYWGKLEGGHNLPATPSLALTLGGLETVTALGFSADGRDSVVVDDVERDLARYTPFFAELRRALGTGGGFVVGSRNGFPGGAGFASSSSGFAALALAAARLVERTEGRPPFARSLLSELARRGSASAARAVYGGFTLLEAGSKGAEAFLPASHWPALRVVAAVVARGEKAVSSRSGMAATRETSPYYDDWVSDAPALFTAAKKALAARDLEALGALMRLSYSRMHASALASDPPLLYWLPGSVALIRACAELRGRGVGAWETMDAGPQVKVLCLEGDLEAVKRGLREALPGLELLVAAPGGEPELFELPPGTEPPLPRSGLS